MSAKRYREYGKVQQTDPSLRKRRRGSYDASSQLRDKKARREDSDHQTDTIYLEHHDKDGHYKYHLGGSVGDVLDVREPERLRYKLIDKLGKGTFGLVLLAWDRLENRYVALKIVRAIKKYTESAQFEIDILTKIQRSMIAYAQPDNIKRVSLFDKSADKTPKKEPLRKDIPPGCSITLEAYFTFKAHTVMVFPQYGLSLYDFLKKNHFRPFLMPTIREIAYHLFSTLYNLHKGLQLIHTDLKPENILFEAPGSAKSEIDPQHFPTIKNNPRRPSRPPKTRFRVPVSNRIKLIDFGSAIFEHDHHSSIIATRHYRPPEVILDLGWSYPSDIWSAGCIILELYTGETLFQTHQNLEHLAMMEAILGPFPSHILSDRCSSSQSHISTDVPAISRYFKTKTQTDPQTSKKETDFVLDWPRPDTSPRSAHRVSALKRLSDIIAEEDADFADLVTRTLDYDQTKRITAEQAVDHPFFASVRDELLKQSIAAHKANAEQIVLLPVRPSPPEKKRDAKDSDESTSSSRSEDRKGSRKRDKSSDYERRRDDRRRDRDDRRSRDRRSRDRRSRERDRDRHYSRGRDRDDRRSRDRDDRHHSRDRDDRRHSRDRDDRRHSKGRDRDDRHHSRGRDRDYRDKERERERERDRQRRRDREREKSRERDREKDREKEKDRGKDKERNREKDRDYRGRDRPRA